MEKKEKVSSLDLKFLVKELRKNLAGGVFRKIYQWGNQFLFKVFVSGQGEKSLYVDRKRLFLTEKRRQGKPEPENFCMFLRKHLMGQKIRDLEQHRFDRIVEITTDDHILILELLRPGNIILCNSSREIIMPLEIQKFKDRQLKPKTPYRYPPRQVDPFQLDFQDLRRIYRGDKKMVVFLAVDLGFGSAYASELCHRAGLDENRTQAGREELLKLHRLLSSLKQADLNPCIYPGRFVSPFPLKTLEGEPRYFDTFSEALNEYFYERTEAPKTETEEGRMKEKRKEIERIVEEQEKARERFREDKEESKETAELIYKNYQTVDGVLKGIQKALNSGLSWKEIKKRIEKEDTPEAEAVKEIREDESSVVLELDGQQVKLDFRKSVEKNAESYYKDMKWAKKKIEGVKEAKEEKEKKLELLEEREEKAEAQKERKKPKPKKKPKKKWYQKYKWFISTEGFLVIAGKDASQNEKIYKKHLEKGDKAFHADVKGAGLTVLKSNDRDITEQAKREASEFAAAHSKAWANNLDTVDVYCVDKDQVSKSPPSGQSLAKGSFMIEGRREWYRDVELKLSIGVKVEDWGAEVISGPVIAIRKHSDYFVTVRPGFEKASELAEKIKKEVLIKAKPEHKKKIEEIKKDEIQRLIPSGAGEIVKYG